MPVTSAPVPTGEQNRYAFVFPIRPGETKFQISYHLPYSGNVSLKPEMFTPMEDVVVMLPKSMQFSGGTADFASGGEEKGLNIFVAHNAQFDWGFVSAELERAVGKTPTALRLCTVRLARALLPQLPRKSLDYVAHHYGVLDVPSRYPLNRGTRHSAAGDAIITAHCLLRMIDDAADRGFTTWDDIQRATSRGSRARKRRPSPMPTGTLDDRTA